MKNQAYSEREDVKLRKKYDEGLLSSEDFLFYLFNSKEADRLRRAIVSENELLMSDSK